MAVLDTNVIIEVARGNKELLDRVLSIDSYFLITSITRFEIMVGAPKLVELNLIGSLDCLPFDERSADVSAYLQGAEKIWQRNELERPLHRRNLHNE